MVGKDKLSIIKSRTIILLTVVMSLFGCKTLQQQRNPVIHEQYNTATIVEKALQVEPQFQTVDIKKMNLKVTIKDKKYNSPATCRIVRDSVVYISIQPFLGIEMFVAMLTPDEIVFIDKTKGIYFEADYQLLNQKFNVDLDYNIVQSLLLNKLFVVGEKKIHPSLFKKTKEQNIAPALNYENGKYKGSILFNPDFRINNVEVAYKSEAERLIVRYADFGITGNIPNFPYSILFNIAKTSTIFGLEMNITRMSADEPITIPLLNLQKYRQGDISILLK